jgi:hypothetical protein
MGIKYLLNRRTTDNILEAITTDHAFISTIKCAASTSQRFMGVESEDVCKETVVIYFKMLSQNFNGEREENHGNSVRILESGSRY